MRGCIWGECPSGHWPSKCLVEDEWVMKPKDPMPSSQDMSLNQLPTPARQSAHPPAITSWEEIPTTPTGSGLRALESSLKGLAPEVNVESWEDLAESPAELTGYSSQEGADNWEELADEEMDKYPKVVEGRADVCLDAGAMSVVEAQVGSEAEEPHSVDSQSPIAGSSAPVHEVDSESVQTSNIDNDKPAELADQASASGSEGMDRSSAPAHVDKEEPAELTDQVSDSGSDEVCQLVAQEASEVGNTDEGSESADNRECLGNETACELVDHNRMLGRLELLLTSLDMHPSTCAAEPLSAEPEHKHDGVSNAESVASDEQEAEALPVGLLQSMTSLQRLTTANCFDDCEDLSPANATLQGMSCFEYAADLAQEFAPCNTTLQSTSGFSCGGVDVHGVLWMPMVFPVYGESCCAPAAFQTSLPPQLSHASPAFRPPSSLTPPHPQLLDCVFNAATGIHRISWPADARQLQGKNCRLVSPPFELSLWEDRPPTVFKMMIHPRHNSFGKSKGIGLIKLKCESDLCGLDAEIEFKISVASDARGPFSHNFSSHSIAELPHAQQLWDLRGGQDGLSKTVLICLEVKPCLHPQAAAPAEDLQAESETLCRIVDAFLQPSAPVPGLHEAVAESAEVSEFTEVLPSSSLPRRHALRSEAGQQRQRERHARRREQRQLYTDAEVVPAAESIPSEAAQSMVVAEAESIPCMVEVKAPLGLDACLIGLSADSPDWEEMSEGQSTFGPADDDASEQAWSVLQDDDKDDNPMAPVDRNGSLGPLERLMGRDADPDGLCCADFSYTDYAEAVRSGDQPVGTPGSRRPILEDQAACTPSWATMAASAATRHNTSVCPTVPPTSSRPSTLREEMDALAASLGTRRGQRFSQHPRANNWASK